MQKVWVRTLVVLIMAALFAGGLVLGLSVNEPDNAALRAETEEQQRELTSLQSRLTDQDSQIADLSTQLADTNAERSGLTVSLEASRSTARDLEQDAAHMSSELGSIRTQLDRSESALSGTEDRNRKLQLELLEVRELQTDLNQAFDLLSELEELTNTKFGPNHGDALLLVEEGYLAANNRNRKEAAAFFEEASKAFELAKANAEEVTTKSEEIASLVPEDANQTFITSHRNARATVFAMEAQARNYEAAGHLYTILEEWTETDSPSARDKTRWRDLADKAEDQFEMAMSALDGADTWSPGLWRRTEALRLNVRDWRNLLFGIRINIIDAPERSGS